MAIILFFLFALDVVDAGLDVSYLRQQHAVLFTLRRIVSFIVAAEGRDSKDDGAAGAEHAKRRGENLDSGHFSSLLSCTLPAFSRMGGSNCPGLCNQSSQAGLSGMISVAGASNHALYHLRSSTRCAMLTPSYHSCPRLITE